MHVDSLCRFTIDSLCYEFSARSMAMQFFQTINTNKITTRSLVLYFYPAINCMWTYRRLGYRFLIIDLISFALWWTWAHSDFKMNKLNKLISRILKYILYFQYNYDSTYLDVELKTYRCHSLCLSGDGLDICASVIRVIQMIQ